MNEIQREFEVPDNWSTCWVKCDPSLAEELGMGFTARYGVVTMGTPNGFRIDPSLDDDKNIIRPDSQIENDFRDMYNEGLEVIFT